MSTNEPPPGAQPTPGISTSGPGTGSQATTPPPAADDPLLSESLEDASVLLWYATREGKPVDDKLVEAVVETKALLSAGQRHHEVETRFWRAYRDLAVVVLPVTVDSILATYGNPFGGGKERSYRTKDAMTTKRRYSSMALIVLFVLLTAQIYWFVGASFRTDLEQSRNELDRIAGILRQEMTPVQTNEEQPRASTPPADDGLRSTNAVDSQACRIIRVENNTRRGDRLTVMITGYIQFLDTWDLVLGEIGQGPTPATTLPQLQSTSDAAKERTECDIINVDQLYEKVRYMESVLYTGEIDLSLVNTNSTLTVIDRYLLPLLYGLLGALAYILRTLSTEIQSLTFTRGSDIRYSLRWPLGMLAGVTVGLFFDPATLSGWAAITPLALAFLAGYGVELVFTGLDRLVHAFTREDSSKAQPT